MNKKTFFAIGLFAVLGAAYAERPKPLRQAQGRPNVISIKTDDQRFDSLQGELPIYEALFNLKDDPNEQVNLADNPEYANVLNDQRQRCQELVIELSK